MGFRDVVDVLRDHVNQEVWADHANHGHYDWEDVEVVADLDGTEAQPEVHQVCSVQGRI